MKTAAKVFLYMAITSLLSSMIIYPLLGWYWKLATFTLICFALTIVLDDWADRRDINKKFKSNGNKGI